MGGIDIAQYRGDNFKGLGYPPLKTWEDKRGGEALAAYILVRVELTDPEQYKKYTQETPAVIAQYGGKFIVRGGPIENMEGPEETARIVILEFPTMDDAKRFYHSEEYQRVRLLREGAAQVQLFAIDGYKG
ncbi:hypothetical protein VN12_17430 [Pirellula sp. SH-Sr6A]|nr:hypothetical protein VN12_17430 [Pirellula sp. SH-Sr6A]